MGTRKRTRARGSKSHGRQTPREKPLLLSADPILQSFVSLVKGTDISIPLTLNMGGLLISGELVSGHKYFEGLAEEFRHKFGVQHIPDEIQKFGNMYKKGDKDPEQIFSHTYFVHFRNARIFQPGRDFTSTTEAWWRGRLEAVDGFMLG